MATLASVQIYFINSEAPAVHGLSQKGIILTGFIAWLLPTLSAAFVFSKLVLEYLGPSSPCRILPFAYFYHVLTLLLLEDPG